MYAQTGNFPFYNGNISYAGTGEKSSGVPVTVCSTGIGGPSAAIALEELVQCGAGTDSYVSVPAAE